MTVSGTHSEYKCWMCDHFSLVPHPDRSTKNHPYEEWSFICTRCIKDDGGNLENLVCCECKIGMCEWWYGSCNEIWEGTYSCKYCWDDSVFCQGCYFEHQKSSEHVKKRRKTKEKEEEETKEFSKWILSTYSKKKRETKKE